MIIRCLVVDDEPPAIEELSFLLNQIEDVEVVGKASSAVKALDSFASLEPDVVFLDIQMPDQDGFQVARKLLASENAPLFVFATAYDQYAVRAFDVEAADYILKPFSEARVRRSIDRVRQRLASMKQAHLSQQVEQLVQRFDSRSHKVTRISVESKGRILILDPNQILFLKAENKGITVYTRDKSYLLHGQSSLDDLNDKLTPYNYFRTHRSYLVNLTTIKEVIPWFSGRYLVALADDQATEIPVSRQRVKALKKLLGL